MFCTNCGSKNNEEVKFCVNCGKEANASAASKTSETAKTPTKGFKKWLSIGFKIVWLIILVPIVISSLVYAYQWYQELPSEVNGLAGISLGMKPVDVTLTKGKQSGEKVGDDGRLRYIYTDYSGNPELFIKFADSTGEGGVVTICSYEYRDRVFDLGKLDSLSKVLNKLGEPTGKSISADGTRQLITYSQYRVAFIVAENRIEETCATSEEKMTFIEEY